MTTPFGVIYLLRNTINGKCYVGQHVNSPKYSLKKRWIGHQRRDSTCTALRNAIQKYGWDKFEKSVICECKTGGRDRLNGLERYFIKKYKSLTEYHGYNLMKGGANGRPSQETLQRLSMARRGEKNHNFGKTFTDEHKQKLSAAKKGMSIVHKGSFKKGNKPWNTGTKGVMKPNEGSFTKGSIPWNKGKKGGSSWNKGTKGVMKTNKGSFTKGNIPWNSPIGLKLMGY